MLTAFVPRLVEHRRTHGLDRHLWHSQDARGDQCDGCGALLNPTELINPKCKMTGTTPVKRCERTSNLDTKSCLQLNQTGIFHCVLQVL